MATVQVVPDSPPDPKLGTKRRISGVLFPYYGLEKSIEVAKAIFERAGGSCSRAQLIEFLHYKSVNNGSFLTRVTSAKMFGLITQVNDQLQITDLGRAIVAPVTESAAERARAEAFLNVELFKKVYDEYNGQTLPPEVGLRNLLLTKYQIVPDRVSQTVNVMMDSADTAGFFKISGNRTKMVMPIFSGAASGATGTTGESLKPKDDKPPIITHPSHGGGSGGGGGGGDHGGGVRTLDSQKPLHPAIYGLLRDLPPAGTLPAKRRLQLIAAFTAAVEYIYPEPE